MALRSYDYTGAENLEVMQEAKVYNRYLASLVMLHKPEGAMNIVDFGAGIGTFSTKIREMGCSPLCVEIDNIQREILAKQSFRAFGNIVEISSEHINIDYVFSLNVLEHISDDVEIINQISTALVPGGTLLVYVPAFNCLYSSMDRLVGHVRRYRKSELIEKIEKSGLAVVKSSYVDSLGFFASLVFKIFGSDSGRLNRRSVAVYDKYVFPISNLLDNVFGSFLGKNVYVVAKKALPPLK